MRVMCIDREWTYLNSNQPLPPPFPIFGEVYTVAGEINDETGEFYILQEFVDAFGDDEGWEKCGFIPVSEMDEENMERNYNFAKILR